MPMITAHSFRTCIQSANIGSLVNCFYVLNAVEFEYNLLDDWLISTAKY